MPGFDITATGPGGVRLEATVTPRASADTSALRGLDVLPPLQGVTHVLLSPARLVDLVAAGFDVLVFAVHPIGPLDPELVMDDAAAQAWIDDRVSRIRSGGRS